MTNSLLDTKVDAAIKLLRLFSSSVQQQPDPILELSYSGGKDSDVILRLAQMAGIPFQAIYKNTTIDPPGTLAHCQQNGVEIIQPKHSFLELVKTKGMPTRRARFCCRYLKEYKIHDNAIQGIRRCESVKRTKNYSADDPIICRNYGAKKNHVNIALPILNWTDEDVESFISRENIKCHKLYYNPDGSFNVSERLGCIGCPLQADQGLADYKAYPKMFKAVAKALCIWWETHPNTKSRRKFETPYNLIGHNLFFRTYEKYYLETYTLFYTIDWKQRLEETFSIEL